MGYTVLFSQKAEKYLKSLQSEIAKHVKEGIHMSSVKVRCNMN
jgi:mRNA-degrading endonuclease RelE of RelBE toxin-antitoxin system